MEERAEIVAIIDLRTDKLEMPWKFNYDWIGTHRKTIESAQEIKQKINKNDSQV